MNTVVSTASQATNQTLGAAVTYSIQLGPSDFPPDGLMGMAFQYLSLFNAPPFFQTLVYQGQVTDPVFSYYLGSSQGELYLGGSSSTLYAGAFTYTNLTTLKVSSGLGRKEKSTHSAIQT